MLRKRILASAMASVMAIGSVSVVASADVTVAQMASKAELELYVQSFENFRYDDRDDETNVYDYGSISGENFLDAIEYADNVLADANSTDAEYGVAYKMLEMAYSKLKIYTKEELKSLISKTTKTYEDDNILNPTLGDNVYTADSFTDFVGSYTLALDVLDSKDSRVITDAYEALERDFNALVVLPTVSKSDFRTALKAYESMLQKQYAYEDWRVGTMSSDWVDLKQYPSGSETSYWVYNHDKVKTVAYGTLYQHVASAELLINNAYEQIDEIRGLNKTSLQDVVEGYYSAKNCVALMDAWTPDGLNRATKANVATLLKDFHGQLVFDYKRDEAYALFNEVVNVTTSSDSSLVASDVRTKLVENNASWRGDPDQEIWSLEYSSSYSTDDNGPWNNPDVTGVEATGAGLIPDSKLLNAGLYVKAIVTFYIPLDEDGLYWDMSKPLTLNKPIDTKYYKTVTKKSTVNLADYIDVRNHRKDRAESSDIDIYDVLETISTIDNGDINGVRDGEEYFPLNEDNKIQNTTTNGNLSSTSAHPLHVYTDSDGVKRYSSRTYLDIAMELADYYLNSNSNQLRLGENPIYDLYGANNLKLVDTTDSIIVDSAKGSSAEWTMVYRYLYYALHDKYSQNRAETHTREDVLNLIDDAYELAELTGEASLFSFRHNALVDARQNALDWVKVTRKDRTYKDNAKKYPFDSYVEPGLDSKPAPTSKSWDATDAYTDLKKWYDRLNEDYQAFKYSFQDIYNEIANAMISIDTGEITATPELTALINDTAYELSTVESLYELKIDETGQYIDLDNDAFTEDRYFQGFNRLLTDSDGYKLQIAEHETVIVGTGPTDRICVSHTRLKEHYEKLRDMVKELKEKPKFAKGDLDQNGTINALDASVLLKHALAGTTGQISVDMGDMNGDGQVNALDASEILKIALKG